MNELTRFEDTGTARFITFSCYHNYNLLKTDAVRMIFVNHLDRTREKYGYKLFGYAIMPNHVHLVLLPSPDTKLGTIIGELKSITAREVIAHWKAKGLEIFGKLKIQKDGKERFALWQKRYYDHNCRSKKTAVEKINYCHDNPVKKGLVAEPGDWRWSSSQWYNGTKDALIAMDEFE